MTSVNKRKCQKIHYILLYKYIITAIQFYIDVLLISSMIVSKNLHYNTYGTETTTRYDPRNSVHKQAFKKSIDSSERTICKIQ